MLYRTFVHFYGIFWENFTQFLPNWCSTFVLTVLALVKNNFREVNDNILKDWLDFREETDLAFVNDEDIKHTVKFDEISEKILNSIPKQNKKFVEK